MPLLSNCGGRFLSVWIGASVHSVCPRSRFIPASVSTSYLGKLDLCYGSAGPSVDQCISEAKSIVGITPGLVSGVESGVRGSEWQRSRCPGSHMVGSVMKAKFGRLLTKSSLRLNRSYWFVYIQGRFCFVSRPSVIVVRHQSAE
jgi:hypothetical protein